MESIARTYGELSLGEKCWLIEAEPHVALRFKRVFAGVKSHALGALRIDDTIDNARDLEWFVERYPLKCSFVDYLRQRANAHRDRETLVSKLMAGHLSSLDLPLAIPARPYQEVAAALLRARGSLLLADDVGLGKTVSAIAAFADASLRPVLVATLAHLPKQWTEFVNRFAPQLSCHTLKKGSPYDLRDKRGNLPDVILSSYHKLAGWADTLAPILKSVVWDECQELRHNGTAKHHAASYLAEKVPFKMGLSATPIYNYGHEIYNVMSAISPEALGSQQEFLTEWCRGGTSIVEPRAFGSYMRDSGLMLRRTRADVGRELPGLSVIPHPVESGNAALDELGSCEDLARVILAESEEFRGQKMQAAGEFDMRLRQATGIDKAPYVASFVEMLAESGEQIVLYGWHRAVYSIWLDRLAKLNPVLYTGSESPSQKDAARRQFISGESRVLLISLRSGAGLDGLQAASKTVVFGELDWSPGVHEQCIGRVYRDGQPSPVFAYYLVSNSGSDPVIADLLGIKTAQIEGLRNPQMELVKKLEVDPDHIKKLAAAYLRQRGGRR